MPEVPTPAAMGGRGAAAPGAGETRGDRRAAPESHYASPGAWASGADVIYAQLVAAALEISGISVDGLVVADLGAGTGATSGVIRGLGGSPVAVDLSWLMLAHDRRVRPPGVVADVAALPLATGSVGASVAAFVLSHVDRPSAALEEAGRVTRSGGPLVAVVFADNGVRHPAVAAVDAVARRWGWAPPSWYRHLKDLGEPAVAEAAQLQCLARQAALCEPAVIDHRVDVGVLDPPSLLAWRLAGPALAGFVGDLPPERHEALRGEALEALEVIDEPLRLLISVLVARSPGREAGQVG